MKRTPLKRSTPLRARAPMKRKPMRRRPRRARPGDDPAYRARVRALPCCARHMSGCTGPVDPHHAGGLAHGRGTGLKPPDRTCIPICRGHHDALHDGRYPFSADRGWPKDRRLRWMADQMERTQKELDAPPFCPEQDRVDEGHERFTVECCQGVE